MFRTPLKKKIGSYPSSALTDESLDDLWKNDAGKLIQLSDLEKDAKLVPRYHHKALLWLIDEKLFDPAAHTFVQSLADEMQDNLE